MKSCKETRNGKTQKEFENMFKYKAMKSLCAPGEPVGLLAAQVKFALIFLDRKANKFLIVNWGAFNSDDIKYLSLCWKR